MKTYSLSFLACLVLISESLWGQQTFSDEYFIDNNGNKTECLIKDKGWLRTPESFVYKLSDTDVERELDITNAAEVGVGSALIFQRTVVQADLSNTITSNGKAVLTEQKIFLRKLLESEKASLYQYSNGGDKYFFFEIKNQKEITQLIRKKYYTNDRNIQTNFQFRTQLLQFAYCDQIGLETYNNLKYNESRLVDFFESYNTCKGVSGTTYKFKPKGKGLNLKVNVGSSFLTYALDQPTSDRGDVDLELDPSVRLGIEAEYYLNFNKNKWSIVLDANYERFKGVSSETPDGGIATIPDFSSINLGIGIRHHLYFGEDSKIIVGLGYLLQSIDDIEVDFSNRFNVEVPNYSGFLVGVGFGYKRLQVEVGYLINQLAVVEIPLWNNSTINGPILELNYRILGK